MGDKTENRTENKTGELGMIDTALLELFQEKAKLIENNDKVPSPVRQLAYLCGQIVKLIADLDVRLARLENIRRYPQ